MVRLGTSMRYMQSDFNKMCPFCHGAGRKGGPDQCHSCGGEGYITPYPRRDYIGGGRVYCYEIVAVEDCGPPPISA